MPCADRWESELDSAIEMARGECGLSSREIWELDFYSGEHFVEFFNLGIEWAMEFGELGRVGEKNAGG